MPRSAVLAALAAVAATGIGMGWAGAASSQAAAERTLPPPTGYLSWPGKTGQADAPRPETAPAETPAHAPAAGRLALSRQFFGGGDDLAAPPPPLAPRPVPGTQAATSSANTASNRARQNEILTADSAADGPVAGAEAPN